MVSKHTCVRMGKSMSDAEFQADVKKMFERREYRPELVIVAHKKVSGERCFLFVGSTSKNPVWNLPQEGVNEGESIERAFLRAWAEELCNSSCSGSGGFSLSQDVLDEIRKKFKKRKVYDIFYWDDAKTPGRSRDDFTEGKRYYYMEVAFAGQDEDLERYNRDEISDFEWVNLEQAKLLMLTSGVNRRKRHITEAALKKVLQR